MAKAPGVLLQHEYSYERLRAFAARRYANKRVRGIACNDGLGRGGHAVFALHGVARAFNGVRRWQLRAFRAVLARTPLFRAATVALARRAAMAVPAILTAALAAAGGSGGNAVTGLDAAPATNPGDSGFTGQSGGSGGFGAAGGNGGTGAAGTLINSGAAIHKFSDGHRRRRRCGWSRRRGWLRRNGWRGSDGVDGASG